MTLIPLIDPEVYNNKLIWFWLTVIIIAQLGKAMNDE
jgi:hypothetical protein